MELSNEICERARLARDHRFDGRFFIGVTSTGIYCRPICPVQPPQAKNVKFYPSAAAAAEAGFRPCLRCRPEFSPGTPAWLGTSATVSRALRLIQKGALDFGNVEDLATSLGMGSRHLRRLFVQHLGAAPSSVAQTRRLHFAKRLIDDTELSMTDIALASGYKSIRSFNYEFKKTYNRSPTELRAAAKHRTISKEGGQISVRIPFNQPLDWQSLLETLALRAIPGVEEVTQTAYRRTFALNQEFGLLHLELLEEGVFLLTIHYPGIEQLFLIVERIKLMFDVAAPLMEIAQHLGNDPLLAPLVKAYPGVRVPGAWGAFETSIRCVLGQQISIKSASTLAGRIAKTFGTPLPSHLLSEESSLSHVFPEPQVLATAELGEVGVIRTRTKAIQNFSTAVAEGKISFEPSQNLESFVEQLVQLPGIGPWTANAIAMRTLHEPDAFPASDLGIRKALEALGKPMTERELLTYAEAWRPWRAYATMLLWRDLGTP